MKFGRPSPMERRSRSGHEKTDVQFGSFRHLSDMKSLLFPIQYKLRTPAEPSPFPVREPDPPENPDVPIQEPDPEEPEEI